MQSPEYVQTSLAAAITLGFKEGKFHRDAKLKALNILLTYEEGCGANCAYCGLARSRKNDETFIRVSWPTYSLKDLLEKSLLISDDIQRVCVSMVTHPRALDDLCKVVMEIKKNTPFPVSALITPSMINGKHELEKIFKSGVDKIGIAVDAATEKLFNQHRGSGVNGPHQWSKYWQTVEDAVEVFGQKMVGIHLVVGLGETEAEMVNAIQSAHDMGALTHLFSFFPERGTKLAELAQPPLGNYRRVQLARYLINEELVEKNAFEYNDKGQIINLGIQKDVLEKIIEKGEPFLTSGCTGKDGQVACNRPYGNERPSQPIRNFPFNPVESDILDIKLQLEKY